MNRQQFFEELAFLLESDPTDLSEATDFRAHPNYNSLVAIGIVAMLEESIGTKLEILQLRNLKNIGELMDLAGREKLS